MKTIKNYSLFKVAANGKTFKTIYSHMTKKKATQQLKIRWMKDDGYRYHIGKRQDWINHPKHIKW